jgi:hypothetical protein
MTMNRRDWWQDLRAKVSGLRSKGATPRARGPIASLRRVPIGSEGYMGTSRVGSILLPYAALEQKFGRPDQGDGDKTHFEWQFVDNNGDTWVLYDQEAREGRSEESTRKKPAVLWHIGGHSRGKVLELKRLLRDGKKKTKAAKKAKKSSSSSRDVKRPRRGY